MIRYLMALASALAALNVFLLGYPGDAVSDGVLLGVGSATAFAGGLAAYLAKP